MSGYGESWPEKGPRVELHVNVSSGTLSLTGTNKVLNYSDFDFTAPNLRGLVFVNGAYQDELAIAAATGVITLSSFSVSTNDIVEFRFRLVGTVSDPWTTRLQLDRTLRLKVPAGTSTTDFDSSNNVMPVPSIDLTFGWDSNDQLKLGFKVNGDDGASEDATVATRLTSCPDKVSSSTLDLDSSSTQTHVSTFTQWEGDDQVLFSYHLKSSTADTRVEDRWQLVLCDRLSVPDYPTGFPTSGVRLKQRSLSGALKLER